MVNKSKVCSDCIHFHACQSWAFGILGNTDAELCKYYETIVDSNAYYLGQVDADKRNKPMKPIWDEHCWRCPVCKRGVCGETYCGTCGQALDWTEVEG